MNDLKQYNEGEVQKLAVQALGRISIEITQPGNAECDTSFDTPDYDYLVTRSGNPIGYGEIANLYSQALAAEMNDLR